MPKKMSIILLITLLVAVVSLLATSEVIAQWAPDACVLSTAKDGDLTISILPRNGEWPIVVTDTDPDYPCPPGVSECLAWVYVCTDQPGYAGCNNFSHIYTLIHRCSENPIQPLSDKAGPIQPGSIFLCTDTTGGANSESHWPDACNSFQLNIPSDQYAGSKYRFWFTTQRAVDVDWIDLKGKFGNPIVHCASGIKGPGCTDAVDPFQAIPQDTINNVGGVDIWYIRNFKGCTTATKTYNDPIHCGDDPICAGGSAGWIPGILTDAPSIGGETVVAGGDTTGNAGPCNELTIVAHGSPGWVWNKVGDHWELSCIGFYVGEESGYPQYDPPTYCCDRVNGCVPKP